MTVDQIQTEVHFAVVGRKFSVEEARAYGFVLKERIIDEAVTPEDAKNRLSELVEQVRLLATRAANAGRYRESQAYDAISNILEGGH